MTDSVEPTVPPTRPTGSNSDPDNPVEDAIKDDARASAKGKLGWLSVTVAAIFGLFYAYALWTAVSHAFEISTIFTEAGAQPKFVPWWTVVVAIVLPFAIFLLAFRVGLRRNVFAKALIFIVGLAALSALSLSLLGFETLVLNNSVEVPTRIAGDPQ